MTKLKDQFPRAGIECRFYLIDSTSFIGFFDHGGAYNWSAIQSSDGSPNSFKQFGKDRESYDNIVGWEYTKK